MQHDAKLLRVPFPTDSEAVRGSLLRLVEANQAQTGTLRIVVVRNRGGIWEGPGLDRDYDLIALTTKLKDWGEGTRLAVVPQARHSAQMFAGVKSLSWSMNLCWYEMAQSRGYDEALLLNEHGRVSECTSANIFAAVGDRVYTPPLGSGCLPGVTRDVLLSGAHVPGIVVEEKDLALGGLGASRRSLHHIHDSETYCPCWRSKASRCGREGMCGGGFRRPSRSTCGTTSRRTRLRPERRSPVEYGRRRGYRR